MWNIELTKWREQNDLIKGFALGQFINTSNQIQGRNILLRVVARENRAKC